MLYGVLAGTHVRISTRIDHARNTRSDLSCPLIFSKIGYSNSCILALDERYNSTSVTYTVDRIADSALRYVMLQNSSTSVMATT